MDILYFVCPNNAKLQKRTFPETYVPAAFAAVFLAGGCTKGYMQLYMESMSGSPMDSSKDPFFPSCFQHFSDTTFHADIISYRRLRPQPNLKTKKIKTTLSLM